MGGKHIGKIQVTKEILKEMNNMIKLKEFLDKNVISPGYEDKLHDTIEFIISNKDLPEHSEEGKLPLYLPEFTTRNGTLEFVKFKSCQ
jgi:hypothetical protein